MKKRDGDETKERNKRAREEKKKKQIWKRKQECSQGKRRTRKKRNQSQIKKKKRTTRHKKETDHLDCVTKQKTDGEMRLGDINANNDIICIKQAQDIETDKNIEVEIQTEMFVICAVLRKMMSIMTGWSVLSVGSGHI